MAETNERKPVGNYAAPLSDADPESHPKGTSLPTWPNLGTLTGLLRG